MAWQALLVQEAKAILTKNSKVLNTNRHWGSSTSQIVAMMYLTLMKIKILQLIYHTLKMTKKKRSINRLEGRNNQLLMHLKITGLVLHMTTKARICIVTVMTAVALMIACYVMMLCLQNLWKRLSRHTVSVVNKKGSIPILTTSRIVILKLMILVTNRVEMNHQAKKTSAWELLMDHNIWKQSLGKRHSRNLLRKCVAKCKVRNLRKS